MSDRDVLLNPMLVAGCPPAYVCWMHARICVLKAHACRGVPPSLTSLPFCGGKPRQVSTLRCFPAGAMQILINREHVSINRNVSEGFDVELLGDCDDVITELCTLLGWDLAKVQANTGCAESAGHSGSAAAGSAGRGGGRGRGVKEEEGGGGGAAPTPNPTPAPAHAPARTQPVANTTAASSSIASTAANSTTTTAATPHMGVAAATSCLTMPLPDYDVFYKALGCVEASHGPHSSRALVLLEDRAGAHACGG
jgi:hypothetical protein